MGDIDGDPFDQEGAKGNQASGSNEPDWQEAGAINDEGKDDPEIDVDLEANKDLAKEIGKDDGVEEGKGDKFFTYGGDGTNSTTIGVQNNFFEKAPTDSVDQSASSLTREYPEEILKPALGIVKGNVEDTVRLLESNLYLCLGAHTIVGLHLAKINLLHQLKSNGYYLTELFMEPLQARYSSQMISNFFESQVGEKKGIVIGRQVYVLNQPSELCLEELFFNNEEKSHVLSELRKSNSLLLICTPNNGCEYFKRQGVWHERYQYLDFRTLLLYMGGPKGWAEKKSEVLDNILETEWADKELSFYEKFNRSFFKGKEGIEQLIIELRKKPSVGKSDKSKTDFGIAERTAMFVALNFSGIALVEFQLLMELLLLKLPQLKEDTPSEGSMEEPLLKVLSPMEQWNNDPDSILTKCGLTTVISKEGATQVIFERMEKELIAKNTMGSRYGVFTNLLTKYCYELGLLFKPGISAQFADLVIDNIRTYSRSQGAARSRDILYIYLTNIIELSDSAPIETNRLEDALNFMVSPKNSEGYTFAYLDKLILRFYEDNSLIECADSLIYRLIIESDGDYTSRFTKNFFRKLYRFPIFPFLKWYKFSLLRGPELIKPKLNSLLGNFIIETPNPYQNLIALSKWLPNPQPRLELKQHSEVAIDFLLFLIWTKTVRQRENWYCNLIEGQDKQRRVTQLTELLSHITLRDHFYNQQRDYWANWYDTKTDTEKKNPYNKSKFLDYARRKLIPNEYCAGITSAIHTWATMPEGGSAQSEALTPGGLATAILHGLSNKEVAVELLDHFSLRLERYSTDIEEIRFSNKKKFQSLRAGYRRFKPFVQAYRQAIRKHF